jgi:hypothetical protein
VALDRRLRHAEQRADSLVRQPGAEQHENLLLTPGEGGQQF